MSEQQQTLTIEQAIDLAVQHHKAGRLSDAENIYRQILRSHPDQPVALHLLGVIAYQVEKHNEAVDLITKSLNLKPNYPEAHNDLGNAFKKLGRLEDALTCYQKALAHKPDFAEAHSNLGNALRNLGKLEEAVASCHKALALNPDLAETHNNLGNAIRELGKPEEAIASYRKAIALNPDYAEAYSNEGVALQDLKKFEEAVPSYHKALTLNPDLTETHNNLGVALQKLGKLEEAVTSYRKALSLKPDYAEARSNLLFSLLPSTIDLKTLFEEHCLWEKNHAMQHQRIQHQRNGNPDKRLRVGFVSADFRDHSVSYFIEAPFSSYDREKIAIYCYSNSYVEDARTALLQSLVEEWRCIASWEDAKIVDIIQADQIDILVDLSGHTMGQRLSVFARKPAPVQVTWLGYPGITTGLTAIDYRLTDDIADPPGVADRYCVERLVRLPNGHHCYQPHEDAPEIGPVPMTTGQVVTFASFNALTKITPEVVNSWVRILQAVPQSRLFLKNWHSTSPGTRQRYMSYFGDSIDPKRIVFKPWTSSKRNHFAIYNEVDIALDTFPFNGITSTCEALWMGVPVVTWHGDRYSGRVGASLLNRVGLGDLAAHNIGSYVKTSITLAGNPERLKQFRLDMRNRLRTSPLCDGVGFARDLESIFRNVWRDWCQSQQSRRPNT